MERKFLLLPGICQVSLVEGEAPEDIVPVLSDAAKLAREKRLPALLVISGFGDPATAEAVSSAIDRMHALGAQPSRLAFVAYTLPQYSVYHFAEGYAQKFGIEAKVLVSAKDAKDWLGLRQAPRQAARPMPLPQ